LGCAVRVLLGGGCWLEPLDDPLAEDEALEDEASLSAAPRDVDAPVAVGG
jgi:hypothetical protein